MAKDVVESARTFRLQMAVIDHECEVALDMPRDRYGRTVHAGAATAARDRRGTAAVEAYTQQDLHRPPPCAAIVDRLTFNGTIIETGTDSYRLASTRARAEEPAEAG